jgi:hypothetical protein
VLVVHVDDDVLLCSVPPTASVGSRVLDADPRRHDGVAIGELPGDLVDDGGCLGAVLGYGDEAHACGEGEYDETTEDTERSQLATALLAEDAAQFVDPAKANDQVPLPFLGTMTSKVPFADA